MPYRNGHTSRVTLTHLILQINTCQAITEAVSLQPTLNNMRDTVFQYLSILQMSASQLQEFFDKFSASFAALASCVN